MEGNGLTKVARSSDLLKERLLCLMPNAGKYPTAIKGLSMVRREQAHQTESCFYKPSLSVIIQGAKRSRIGTRKYLYGENQCMIAGVCRACSRLPRRPRGSRFWPYRLSWTKAFLPGWRVKSACP